MDREMELCGQGDGAVWTGRWSCVDREMELCGQGDGAVWTGRWSCVDREMELCGQGDGAGLSRSELDRLLLQLFLTVGADATCSSWLCCHNC